MPRGTSQVHLLAVIAVILLLVGRGDCHYGTGLGDFRMHRLVVWAVGVPGARWLRFVPALLVLATYAQYAYHLPMIMAAVGALFAVCLYVSLVGRREYDRNAECGSPRHSALRTPHSALEESGSLCRSFGPIMYVVECGGIPAVRGGMPPYSRCCIGVDPGSAWPISCSPLSLRMLARSFSLASA